MIIVVIFLLVACAAGGYWTGYHYGKEQGLLLGYEERKQLEESTNTEIVRLSRELDFERRLHA